MSIEVSNLKFSYGDRLIIDNINFTTEDGQLISVLGPNGVGKSTLFRCLLGLLKNYKGKIYLKGKDIKNLSAGEMAKLIAYIPQSHYPSFNYSVFDMVLMGAAVKVSSISSPGKKHIESVNNALEKMGIYHLKDRGYMHISGGERQLVLLARALVQDAKILVMDEPTSNLDFGNQIKVMTQMKNLAKEGYTIIQSAHNPDQTFLFSDKIIAMKGGKIIKYGKPHVISNELIKSLYNVEVEINSLYDDKIRVCIPYEAI